MVNATILSLSALLLVAVLAVAKKRRSKIQSERDENIVRLTEFIKNAELTNGAFFRSLELVQKNLESMLARAESAEERLRGLMLQPGVEKKEQYTAAALLLDRGQEAERVASMLNLPLPQVQIVQELQKLSNKERKSLPRRKRDEEPAPKENLNVTKIAAQREKNSAPILLVDVIRSAAEEAAALKNGHRHYNGAGAVA